jgi:hypothetical protein
VAAAFIRATLEVVHDLTDAINKPLAMLGAICVLHELSHCAAAVKELKVPITGVVNAGALKQNVVLVVHQLGGVVTGCSAAFAYALGVLAAMVGVGLDACIVESKPGYCCLFAGYSL